MVAFVHRYSLSFSQLEDYMQPSALPVDKECFAIEHFYYLGLLTNVFDSLFDELGTKHIGVELLRYDEFFAIDRRNDMYVNIQCF